MAPVGAPKVAKTKLAGLQETAFPPLVILSEAKDLIAIATPFAFHEVLRCAQDDRAVCIDLSSLQAVH
jgi:hypothetical protein